MPLELLALAASAVFVIAFNPAFWRGVTATGAGVPVVLALGVSMTGLHWLLIALLAWGRAAKPAIALMVVAAAAASSYSYRYGVYFDASMVRNMVHTDTSEVRELIVPWMLLQVAAASALPLLVLWRMRLAKRTLWRSAGLRLAWVFAAIALLAGPLMADYRDVSSLMRSQPKLRYLVAPGNLLVSALTVGLGTLSGPPPHKASVGLDAQVVPGPAGRRPRALLVVVGETVRAQNWGLNGYHRQTTPMLASESVVNFSDVSACGTSTEVSLPCMFSFQGLRNYDRRGIRDSQSVLHVLKRAGVNVQWRDNQSGCKGVCDGLPFSSFLHGHDPRFCDRERCFDRILFDGIGQDLADEAGDVVIVLHMLGNHGPTYSRRYPARFEKFRPACTSAALGDCPPETIVNAYDNAILYTDALLAQAIAELAKVRSHDTALVYVSDHGESLGESGLYLHGVPRVIAPAEQLKVPLMLWLSPAWMLAAELDPHCLADRAGRPASHDNLPHTLLGLMHVDSSVYVPELDLVGGCSTDATQGHSL